MLDTSDPWRHQLRLRVARDWHAFGGTNFSWSVWPTFAGGLVTLAGMGAASYLLGSHLKLESWQQVALNVASYVLGTVIFLLSSRVFYRWRAPRQVYLDTVSQHEGLIAEKDAAHQNTVAGLEARVSDLTARLVAATAPTAKEVMQKATEDSRLGNFNLHKAYRALSEHPPDRPDEQSKLWDAFVEALRAYRNSISGLDPIAKKAHLALEWTFDYAVKDGSVARLAEPMLKLSDILHSGELDLDVDCRDLSPRVFRPAGRRNRFVIVNVCVTNREPQAVTVLPNWHLELSPGSEAVFDPDASPLDAWERIKGDISDSANPPLTVPLRLESGHGVVGHWCFFISAHLEFFSPEIEKQERADTWLELYDLVSGKRTTSRGVGVRLEALLKEPPATESVRGADASGELPILDKVLELVHEQAGFTPHSAQTQSPLIPEYWVNAVLEATAEVDPPALQVECTAPIYECRAVYQTPGADSEPVFVAEPSKRKQERVLYGFGQTALPPGTRFSFTFHSVEPLRLRRAVIGIRR